MRILLTNDDGIHADGLSVLESIACELSDDIWVVAPETDQSGLAHSMTLNEPLRLRHIEEKRFALKGTPTDCVIMGIRELMEDPPDLVLSGVNTGQNVGDDVTYSGTVAGAMEGTLLGVPSIALSQAYNFHDRSNGVPWDTARVHAPDIIRKLVSTKFPPKTLINLNFPNCPHDSVAGTRITTQGAYAHGLSLEERHDGRGYPYYWLRFGRNVSEHREGSDIAALRQNFISVTPLKLDLTHEGFRADLNALFDGK
jgi:5'-nucleotidase